MSAAQRKDETTEPLEKARRTVRRSIKALMGANAVSQTQLGQAIGMSQTQMSVRLSGKVPFDEDALFLIATYFGCRVVDLYSPESLLASGYKRDSPALSLIAGTLDPDRPTLPFAPELALV